jgi:hypothetical protein
MSEQSWGFVVERTDREKDYDDDSAPLDEPRFRVWLPHQCDKWEITGGDAESGRADAYASRADAIAEFERFVDEATEALEALRKGATYGDRHRHMFWDD